MDKKDILLGKFIGCQNGFCLTTKSTNENDIYFVQDIVGSKVIIENYNKLTSEAFEAYLNNLSITVYKVGNNLSQLQNVTTMNEYERFTDRLVGNGRSSRLKFKDIIDRVYIRFNLIEQIDILEKQLKNLKKYQDVISEPNQIYTSQKLQAISLLKSLDVKGRTDSQKLGLIKESLSRMEYAIPSFNDVEEFEEELIEPTRCANVIISSEEIVEEQPRSVFVTTGLADQINSVGGGIVDNVTRVANNATYGTVRLSTSGIEPTPEPVYYRTNTVSEMRSEFERMFGNDSANIGSEPGHVDGLNIDDL